MPTRRAARRAVGSRSTRRIPRLRPPLDRPRHVHLAIELLPEEHEGRPRVLGQLPTLAALAVREELEPALVDPAQQDVTCRRPSLRIGRRHRHGVGQRHPGSLGVVEPLAELLDRIVEKVGAIERAVVVEARRRAHAAGVAHRRAIVRRRCPNVPPAGFEPAHPAPEAGALSPELRGRLGESSNRPVPSRRPGRLEERAVDVGILPACRRTPRRGCSSSTTIR